MTLHPKIIELKKRAAPITYSNVSINDKGLLQYDFQDDLDKRIVNGYLIVWGAKNAFGEKAIKGSCAKSIQERGPDSNSKYKITFLWQHDPTDPLSLFDELVEDEYGLRFRTRPLDDVPNADRTINQIRSGTLNQFSAGFNYVWDKMEYDTSDDSIVLKEMDLMEGSVVTRGADTETYALRTANDLDRELLLLNEETEDFIKSIPRKQQLELRQLFTRHKSLAKIEPQELRQAALVTNEPVATGLDYQYILNNLKLF
jgi:HK97 family phage prohead protease